MKDNPQNGRKYLQMIRLTNKGLFPKCKSLISKKPKQSNHKWAENLKRNFSKEDIQKAKRHIRKMFNIANYQRRYKSKLQWGITSHQSEWPSSKSLQKINARDGVEKREPSYILGENVNWYTHHGEQYGEFLKKLKIELPYDAGIPLLGTYPEKN